MRKFFRFIVFVGLGVLVLPSSAQNLISDTAAFNHMIECYQQRKALLGNRIPALFDTADTIKNSNLQEATRFLIAYAPLSDLGNLSPEYFRTQAALALETKRVFAWGKSIPSEVFVHFVLPYRVNNENPDSARQVFFRELQSRIQNMTMYDAALEVNHWCHEQVAYKSTDERTSSPLATMKTAYGRCGEESTFTVTAMRSVGIPARQVYTPRWAHTDDNHAWVEVWVDGKWYFMGACEPDPELNMGWFAGPATRAIMMHTNTFGQYNGPEKTLVKTPLFSKLNLLSNYAQVKKAEVKVVDIAGKPMPDVQVDFMVYNYAEFYPFASFTTDNNGSCSLETGFGDLLVWVTDGSHYTWRVLPSEHVYPLEIVFDTSAVSSLSGEENLYLLPPPLGKIVIPESAKKNENEQRLIRENEIREKYIATFPDSARLVDKYKNDPNAWYLIGYVVKSRGNYASIETFYNNASENLKKDALALLSAISEKDLHDVPTYVLNDHLQNAARFKSKLCPTRELYVNYVLSPRIGRELLTPWRADIQKAFGKKQGKMIGRNPQLLIDWVNKQIAIDHELNYYGTPVSPMGVYNMRIADEYSRNVFFVACCRSFGVPARIEPATNKAQYYSGSWIDAFPVNSATGNGKGYLKLNQNSSFVPVYYTHFTIAKLHNGRFNSLNYEFDETLKSFPATLELEPGTYRLMTGNRQPDGSVFTYTTFFEIEANRTHKETIVFNEKTGFPDVLFTLDGDAEMGGPGLDAVTGVKFLMGNGPVVFALIDPRTEPGKHYLTELQQSADALNMWPVKFALILPSDFDNAGFAESQWQGLPKSALWLYDTDGGFQKILEASSGEKANLPVIVYTSGNTGRVFFYCSGYQINTAQMLLKTIRKVESR